MTPEQVREATLYMLHPDTRMRDMHVAKLIGFLAQRELERMEREHRAQDDANTAATRAAWDRLDPWIRY